MTDSTRRVIRHLFAEADCVDVEERLDRDCGANLPLTESWGEAQFERVWLAVLKLSHGDLERLREAVSIAQRDWRDVLVASGFGHSLEAHRQWAKTLTA